MYEIVIKALRSVVDFDEEELFQFMQKLRPKVLKKGEHVLIAGDVCKAMVLIESGSLRYYKAGDKAEQSFWFAFEGEWLGDYGSFLSKTPSLHYLQALEDSRVYCLYREDMEELYAKGSRFERFGRLIAEQLFLNTEQSRHDLVSLTAEQRYLNLLERHPKIIQRVSQQHIASYLGVQPQSLSRIRARLAFVL